jgi:hypothetical protein
LIELNARVHADHPMERGVKEEQTNTEQYPANESAHRSTPITIVPARAGTRKHNCMAQNCAGSTIGGRDDFGCVRDNRPGKRRRIVRYSLAPIDGVVYNREQWEGAAMGKKRKTKRMSVSEQLRAIIRERRLSTYMVGKLAGIAPTRVNYFLRGGQLRTANLDRICDALGLVLQPEGPVSGREH